jgi:hypothetical protein
MFGVMKRTFYIICLLMFAGFCFSQNHIDWKSVEIYSTKSYFDDFEKKHINDTLYLLGEGHIKIKNNPKNISDLSIKELNKLKKHFSKERAVVVYIDLSEYYAEMKNTYLYLSLHKQ